MGVGGGARRLTFRSPPPPCSSSPSMSLSSVLRHALVIYPLSFVRESLVSLGRRLTRQKGPRENGRWGKLEGRGRGGALSCLDGRWGGFRVAHRARSWPSARGAVGFRGRGRRPPGGSGSGASRGHETARRAVHESPRARDAKASGVVVETRKRFAPRSNSQLAVAKDAGPRISRISADSSWVIEALERRKRIPH